MDTKIDKNDTVTDSHVKTLSVKLGTGVSVKLGTGVNEVDADYYSREMMRKISRVLKEDNKDNDEAVPKDNIKNEMDKEEAKEVTNEAVPKDNMKNGMDKEEGKVKDVIDEKRSKGIYTDKTYVAPNAIAKIKYNMQQAIKGIQAALAYILKKILPPLLIAKQRIIEVCKFIKRMTTFDAKAYNKKISSLSLSFVESMEPQYFHQYFIQYLRNNVLTHHSQKMLEQIIIIYLYDQIKEVHQLSTIADVVKADNATILNDVTIQQCRKADVPNKVIIEYLKYFNSKEGLEQLITGLAAFDDYLQATSTSIGIGKGKTLSVRIQQAHNDLFAKK